MGEKPRGVAFKMPDIPTGQRLHYKVTPLRGQYMTAKHIGGQLIALAKLLETNAENTDKRKWRVAVTEIRTEEDGSVVFDLVFAPINLRSDLANPQPQGGRDSPET